MNSAPAELLQLLSFAAVQPSNFAAALRAFRGESPNLVATFLRVSGVSSAPFSNIAATSRFFFFKEKTARPEKFQARRLSKNGVVLCIFVRICIPFCRSFCGPAQPKKAREKKHTNSIS